MQKQYQLHYGVLTFDWQLILLDAFILFDNFGIYLLH